MMAGRREALLKRLEGYWKMEAGCVFLVPALALWVAPPGDWTDIALYAVVLAPACLSLAVGAGYWFALLAGLRGNRTSMRSLVRVARIVRPLSLLFVGLAVIAAAIGWTQSDQPVRIVLSALALLAVLEWVNYFAIQLQHFDNMPDFKRLLTGKGFRQAHLARELSVRAVNSSYKR